jgi:hypothetical protein
MFDLKNKIEIGDWDIVNNHLFAVQNNEINKFDLLGNYLETIYNLEKYWGVKYYDKFIHIFTMYSENTFIDYKGKIIFTKNNFNYYHFINYNKYIGYDRDIKKVVLFENNNIKELHRSRIVLSKVLSNLFVFSDKEKKVIYLTDLNTARPLWQFNLLQLGSFIGSDGVKNNYKVDKFIAIHKHILFIALNLPSHSIIALDIQTGKLLRKWEQIPYNIGANYDPYSKTIFGFGYQNYWQIDIDTLSLETYNIAETFLQKGLETTRNNVNIPVNQKHYLISIDTPVDEKENRYYNGVALFNKQTKKLDWHYVFDKNVFLGSNDPKMSDNKLYQLDTGGNLYIFEKQTDEQV